MRKQLFKFVSALLVGAVAAAQIGCSDYDDDIAGLNKKIDDLAGGKIATVEQQLAAMQSTLSGLQATDAALDNAVKALEGELSTLESSLAALRSDVDADKSKIAALESLAAGIRSDIAGLTSAQNALRSDVDAIEGNLADYATKSWVASQKFLSTADFEAWKRANQSNLDAVSGALSDIASLKGRVAALEGTDLSGFLTSDDLAGLLNEAQVKAIVEAYGYLTADDVLSQDDVERTLRTAFGEDFPLDGSSSLKAYVESVVSASVTEPDLSGLYTKTEVDEKFGELTDSYYGAVNDVFAEVLEAEGVVSGDSAAALGAALASLDGRIAALEGAVADLASRIQSLVYVPEYNDGKALVEVYTLNGKALTDALVHLTFRVRPAELAARMEGAAGNGQLTLLLREVKDAGTRAAAVPEIKEVKLLDAAEGTFEVFATFAAVDSDVALALSVSNDKVADEAGNIVAGANDRTSEYVQTARSKDSELKGAFALADADGRTFDSRYENMKYDIQGPAVFYCPAWSEAPAERKLLEGFVPKVMLKGEYRTMEEAESLLGLAVGTLKVECKSTPSYYDAAGNTPVKPNEERGIEVVKGSTTALDVALRMMSSRADVMRDKTGYYAKVKHELKVNGVAFPEKYYSVYRISNKQVNIVFDPEQPAADPAGYYFWTYGLYTAQTAAGDTTLEFPEVAVSSDVADVVLSDLTDFLAANAPVSSTVKFDGREVSDVTVGVTPKTSDKFQEIGALSLGGNYEWGGTYSFSYVYDYNDLDVVISGSLVLGPRPADVKLTNADLGAAAVHELAFDSRGVRTSFPLSKIVAKVADYDGYFADGEFATAMAAGSQGAVKVVRNAGTVYETELNAADFTFSVSENGIEVLIPTSQIAKAGDTFRFTTAFTTDFGMKINVDYTARVVMPEYELVRGLKLNSAFENKAVARYENGEWVIDNIDLTEEFFSIRGLNGAVVDANASIAWSAVTKATATNGIRNVPDPSNGSVVWGGFNRTVLELEAVVELNGIEVSKPVQFTVKVDDPLPDSMTAKQIEIVMADYAETGHSFNVWQALSLKDALDNELIAASAASASDVFATVYADRTDPENPANPYTFSAYVNGAPALEFGRVDLQGHDKQFTYADGVFSFDASQALNMESLTVTVPVKLAYRFGEKTANVTVVFKGVN